MNDLCFPQSKNLFLNSIRARKARCCSELELQHKMFWPPLLRNHLTDLSRSRQHLLIYWVIEIPFILKQKKQIYLLLQQFRSHSLGALIHVHVY